ncbi:hypothetical protein [Algoriphagus sp.]|uniref:hypothetical protein n=1 Tax=Algoriphagus sp. TaxID=1872435 RepID=UPI00327BC22A
MKTLLRFYLVLIFASSALNAGSVNETNQSEFPVEAPKFAMNSNPAQNQVGVSDCEDSSVWRENTRSEEGVSDISK